MTAAEQAPAPRGQLSEEHRHALATIVRKGGLVSLGTQEARDTWCDAQTEVVALIGTCFTPEELDIITDGAS